MSAAEKQKTRYYVLNQYFLKNGTQMPRLAEWLSKSWLPELNKVHAGPKLVLEALVAPHMPQVATITGYSSIEEAHAIERRVEASAASAMAAWENAPEQPTEHYSSTLLEATAYSPEITPRKEPPKTPRIFELRVYHSPSHRQLAALHDRFAGPEIRIFHRVGVHPLLYSSTVYGPQKPNLVYVIPFDDLAAREKAWNAFGADPEWVKVRAESIEKHGQISSVIQIALYRAAAYSPIR